MTLRLDEPAWLLGLLLMIPAAIVAVRCFSAMSSPRRWSSIIIRTLLLACLLLLLAGVTLVSRTDRVAVVAVMDVSGSVNKFFSPPLGPDNTQQTLAQAATRLLNESSANRRSGDLLGAIAFASEPRALVPLSAGRLTLPELDGAVDRSESDSGTNAERALRLAAAMVPPDAAGRIVLFSDGVFTAGDAQSAARAVAARESLAPGAADDARSRIPIDVVPLNYAANQESFVESVDAPPTAPAGATVSIRVALRSSSPTSGTLSLMHEGTELDINGSSPGLSRTLSIPAGNHIEVVSVPLPSGRVHRFTAVWQPDGPDAITTNNRAEAFTISPGRGSVLVVDGVSGARPGGPGEVLPRTLAQAGIEVQTIAPDGVRADLLWLQQFDLVILQNVPAEAIARPAHATLASGVTQLGIGLIMVGGPDSFGAGGWKGSAIEPILPVKLDLPERLITPAAALVLVIDNSGSMNRSVLGSPRTQQQIANDGAAIAVESMDKTDLIGVITFNNDFTIERRLERNSDPKQLAKLIRSISADGGTNLPPALDAAHRQLKAAKADIKHIIVLSDGVSQGKEALADMAVAIARDGIKVSTIAIGDAADAGGMSEIAQLGGGEFYRVIDPTLLPRVLLKAVRIVRTPLIREGPFTPAILPTGSPIMDGLPLPLPPLNGLVLTQPRPEPTIVYPLATPPSSSSTDASSGGEPVLGYWNVGVGRVAAFTSDAHKWAGPWINSPTYARFWTQLARTIARAPTDRTQTLTAEMAGSGSGSTVMGGDRLTIRLDSTRDASTTEPEPLSIPGTLYAPDGTSTDIRLAQIGPGQYEAVAPARMPGTYVVTLLPRAGATPAPVVAGVVKPAGVEFRRLSSDETALRRLAETSGGRVIPLATSPTAASAPLDLFSRDDLRPAEARTPLLNGLLIAAVVLFLLDVATRRIAWDRLITREFGAELSREAASAMRDRTAQAQAAIDRLRTPSRPPAGANIPGSSEETPSVPGPLGDADAHRIRDEQAARRRLAREQARQPQSPTPPPRSASPTPPAPSPSTPVESPVSEPGLLAAKRRAQQKMRDE